MIFSKDKKYIYIRVPKTASATISSRLLEIDPNALRNTIVLPNGELMEVHTHTTARQVKQLLGDSFYEYRVVTFVRDPISLIASKYHFYLQRKERLNEQTTNWARFIVLTKVLSAKTLPLPLWAALYPFKTSSHFILDHDGTVLATDIGCFERLSEDFTRIFKRIGFEENELVLYSKKHFLTYDRTTARKSRALRWISRVKCREDYGVIKRVENRPEA